MDRARDAYFKNAKNQKLNKDTIERVDWLLDLIGPGSVLDIGCSEGILGILLARRGQNKVTSVDISDEEIILAKRFLADEVLTVQHAAQFLTVDFLKDNISDFQGCFDTVVARPVLEQISESECETFVERAVSCMSPSGKIVIAFSFVTWKHDEYEQTVFINSLFEILSKLVAVTRIKLVGRQLVMVGTLDIDAEANAFLPQHIWDLERQFFIQKERRLVNEVDCVRKRLQLTANNYNLTPHMEWFFAASQSVRVLSRKRYTFEKTREKKRRLRKLLRPLHWLRLQLGLQLARYFARLAKSNVDLETLFKRYLLCPSYMLFHRDDFSSYIAETYPYIDFLKEMDSAIYTGLDKSHQYKFFDLDKFIKNEVTGLMIFRIHQSRGELEKALMLCRNLLAGKWGMLSSSDRRRLLREPVASLLAKDLLPKKTIERAFDAGGRIGYVVHSSLPYVTAGYTTRTQGFADGLRRIGQDVITITRPGFPLNLMRDLLESDVPVLQKIDSVLYRRILHPIDRLELPYDYIRLAADALEKAFVAENVKTVIAASNYVCALPAIIAARRLGLPCVYEVRGFWEITAKSLDESYVETADFATRVEMESLCACAADRVLTLTAGMRTELILRGVEPDRIFLAPNGFQPTMLDKKPDPHSMRKQLNIPEGCPVIGYIGSFTIYEGLEDLATACVGLHGRGLDFRLLLIGDEKSRNGSASITEKIIATFKQAKLSDKLIMTGRVPFENVPDYYSIVDIAPIPRKPFEVSELVSPIKPLEAMAFETALVVSSVAALTEIVTDGVNGYVFEKGNVGALRDALMRAITDPVTRRQIAEKGKRVALQERTWENIAIKVTGFLFDNKSY